MDQKSSIYIRNIKPITLIAGHYGSGKTEFAVNLALWLSVYERKSTLVDLDIVNPYFRSFERKDLLEKADVKLIATSMGGLADIPALPAEVASIFSDRERVAIVDLGGDPEGARVLGFYEPQLNEADFDYFLVLNANRPETANAEKAEHYMRNIEFLSKQKFTGIINNTHLCRETAADDIIRGEKLAYALADKTGLPVIWNVVEKRLLNAVEGRLRAEIFPIDILMTKPWEEGMEEWV